MRIPPLTLAVLSFAASVPASPVKHGEVVEFLATLGWRVGGGDGRGLEIHGCVYESDEIREALP